MRIGLTGYGSTVDEVIRHATKAEDDGFSALWYSSGAGADPLVAMAIAGRETTSIELGTAVLQTYPCHPILQANRVIAASSAMGRAGLTLGLGPSHESVTRGVFGLSYDHPARNTAEYLAIVSALLRGEDVHVDGTDWSAHTAGRTTPPVHRVPLLLSAMSPRMLRIAGQFADGVILWMASHQAIATRIVPGLRADADADAGRPRPRVVAGLPVAVHEKIDEARSAVAATAVGYAGMANYQRIIRAGGGSNADDVAVVGDEAAVADQLHMLLDAGATDIWAQPVAVGEDRGQRQKSLERTRSLLRELARTH